MEMNIMDLPLISGYFKRYQDSYPDISIAETLRMNCYVKVIEGELVLCVGLLRLPVKISIDINYMVWTLECQESKLSFYTGEVFIETDKKLLRVPATGVLKRTNIGIQLLNESIITDEISIIRFLALRNLSRIFISLQIGEDVPIGIIESTCVFRPVHSTEEFLKTDAEQTTKIRENILYQPVTPSGLMFQLLSGKRCSNLDEAPNEFRQMFEDIRIHTPTEIPTKCYMLSQVNNAWIGIFYNGGVYRFIHMKSSLLHGYFTIRSNNIHWTLVSSEKSNDVLIDLHKAIVMAARIQYPDYMKFDSSINLLGFTDPLDSDKLVLEALKMNGWIPPIHNLRWDVANICTPRIVWNRCLNRIIPNRETNYHIAQCQLELWKVNHQDITLHVVDLPNESNVSHLDLAVEMCNICEQNKAIAVPCCSYVICEMCILRLKADQTSRKVPTKCPQCNRAWPELTPQVINQHIQSLMEFL